MGVDVMLQHARRDVHSAQQQELVTVMVYNTAPLLPIMGIALLHPSVLVSMT